MLIQPSSVQLIRQALLPCMLEVETFLLDGVAGSTYAVGTSTTTGTITIGGTAQTGAITIGSSSGAANSVLIANGSGSTTVSIANVTTAGVAVNIACAASIGTANTVNIITSTTPGATETLNIMSGIGSAGNQVFTYQGAAFHRELTQLLSLVVSQQAVLIPLIYSMLHSQVAQTLLTCSQAPLQQ